MRQLLCYLVAACMAILAWGADATTPAKKKTTTTKKKSTITAHKSTATTAHKTTAASKSGVAKKGTTKKGPAKTASSWRSRQLAPTPDRYQEIQHALAAKGYLRPEDADGKWSPTSMDALKKFQSDQNLEASGKINSLSLIALGLGPKHDTPTKPAENPQ